MKAKDALKILRVSRGTLTNYVKEGKIKVIKLPTGRYDYDEESVYSFLNKDVSRNTVIYARVSTPKQRKAVPNAFADGIEALGLTPLKVVPL
ncbi:MAG: site-specific integrase-resolvase-like protein [Candidatus Magnetoglobus multicellularis str. Araruama]|uniref:Site-specific integrase-resolvase-like protein n=1 Tax=Candidatus Magnetoglobus multicellularis str. Araruama TaxID=890399 RepID=A0A1V1P3Z2_9BACT|nr:MAG: site-specific integrase-resolvase-like protein [Candidatus Magnetoglobus multicellularis str. Araruama]